MYQYLKILGLIAILQYVAGIAISFAQDEHSEMFSQQKSGLFVIEVTDKASSNKNIIGSGFLISSQGLLATNYHVVSAHVLNPDSYNLEYKDVDDNRGDLEVVAVDVVNDLALVRMVETEPQYLSELWKFDLTRQRPEQGAPVMAMGNPYDIGISIVPGVYNGELKKSFQKNIHFTGALNPGMSGGPAVDERGKVIGINVAGAGNSVSFLVPVHYLIALVQRYRRNDGIAYSNMQEQINADLVDYQERLVDDLLQGDWELTEFGPLMIPTTVRPYVDCSGSTSDTNDDLLYEQHTSDCGVHDRIYLSHRLDTGMLEIDYGWYVSDELNQIQFYNLFETANFIPFNRATSDDVTEFRCHEDITRFDWLDDVPFKSTYCVRTYIDYEGLHDILYSAKSLLNRSEGVYMHYTMAGVTSNKAQQFHQQFIRSVQWK